LNFCVLLSRHYRTKPAVQLDYEPFVVFFVDAFRASANLTSSFGALCLSDDFAQRNTISHGGILRGIARCAAPLLFKDNQVLLFITAHFEFSVQRTIR
jgi:hypothetical protein